jgi:uncharacterized repeat protein (TIGR03803 family)
MLPAAIYAQGIYQFWGTTTTGGKDDKGSFFSTRYDGTALQNKPYFTVANSGRSWEGNQPVAYNGKFYSLLRYGGVSDEGIISEYDPATNVYTTKVNLYDLGTGIPGDALTLLGTKMYGVSESSGSLKPSKLFEFDPASGVATTKHIYTNATGEGVGHEPVVYNNKLYGITGNGGNNDLGVIYEFDPATEIYTVKYHFSVGMKGSSYSGLVVYANKLWSADADGTIFSFDPATNLVSQKQNLTQLGGGLYGHFTVLNNRLYGASSFGGPTDNGFIFEYNPANNTLSLEMNLTTATANNRFTLLAHNGLLYGSSIFGGINNEGQLFSYDPVTNDYTILKTYSNAAGGSGESRLIVYNNKLYGWLLNGGYSMGVSSLFEYNLANNQFALKVTLGGGDELQIPIGELGYYKHKLYGAATYGGALNGGGIYAFDLQTQTFEVKVPMAETVGRFSDQGGFLLYNDKFYGVTRLGGTNGKGTLFQYDPNSNVYTPLFNFGGADGDHPLGKLVLFNGKMYGTCNSGSTGDEGTIFEFDPITNVVTTKVAFDGTRGAGPSCGLTVYNGRLFGVTGHGGLTNHGALFEYFPLPNALVKLADFNSNTTGSGPTSKLTAYNNKLWGVTESSSLGSYEGVIYEYNLATNVLSKKVQLVPLTGQMAMAGMTLHNNKFYGMTNLGGNGYLQGVVFEYDPATNNYSVKTDFEPMTGKWARRTELAKVPAPTAPGSGGSCTNTQTININAANASNWIAFTDSEGRAVAEINANGNILGNTAVRVFVNDGNIRQHASGTFYLDRNITITAANTLVTPVSVRLYIRKTEFESLKATAGSGIVVPADLVIYKNNDFCSATMNAAALPLATVKEDWGFDYVYSTAVTSFSSFYFAKLTGALPVKIIYFKGAVENTANKLEWKSACTNDVDFIVERSTDGIHFDSIGIKKAVQLDCNHPFWFLDETPATLSYYRLKLVENNGTITYSAIVVLERKTGKSLQVVITPNPVTGTLARLQITASQQQSLFLKITDVQGRTILKKSATVPAGKSNMQLVLPNMPAGMYYLQYGDGTTQQALKIFRQ